MIDARPDRAAGEGENRSVGGRVRAQRLIVALGLAAIVVVPMVAIGSGRLLPAGLRAVQESGPALVRVTVEALATMRDGATGRPKAGAIRRLSVGESFSAVLVAGEVGRGDLCQVAELNSNETTPWRTRWHLDVQVLDGDPASSLLKVTWQRSTLDPVTEQVTTLPRDERAIRLRAGEFHVLDLVPADAARGAGCANVVLQVSAQPVMPPELVGSWLNYELHLVSEIAGGGRTIRQAKVAGTPGSPVHASFVPVQVPLAGDPISTAPAVAVGVTASIRGVCRDDGSIDVDLETERTVALGRAWTTGRGRKTFVLSSDESVAIELPNPTTVLTTPRSGSGLEGARLAPGVALAGETVTADVARLLAGHRFSVIVRAQCQR